MRRVQRHVDPDRAKRSFAQNLRHARERAGLSQRALAERLSMFGVHLDPSAITRIERGERDAKVAEAVVLAQALSTSVADLLADDPSMQLRDEVYALAARQRRLQEEIESYGQAVNRLEEVLAALPPERAEHERSLASRVLGTTVQAAVVDSAGSTTVLRLETTHAEERRGEHREEA